MTKHSEHEAGRDAAHVGVGIVGDTGMVGSEIDRLLSGHGGVNVVYRRNSSRTIGDVNDCKLVFLATKDMESMRCAPMLLDAGVKVIDMSGAFRIGRSDFEHWYGMGHTAPELISEAVYGLPAVFADEIARARLVAAPGCYPTAVILALRPLWGLVSGEAVVFATSGNSGARRGVEADSNEISYAYGTMHKHVPEMHKYTGYRIDFNPIVLRSVYRGINAVIRIGLSDELKTLDARTAGERIEDAIRAAYRAEDLVYLAQDFVNSVQDSVNSVQGKELLAQDKVVHGKDLLAQDKVVHVKDLLAQSPTEFRCGTRDVNGTNKMLINVYVENGFAYINVLIDNLYKGAAGQAVEDMNLMLGFPRLQGVI